MYAPLSRRKVSKSCTIKPRRTDGWLFIRHTVAADDDTNGSEARRRFATIFSMTIFVRAAATVQRTLPHGPQDSDRVKKPNAREHECRRAGVGIHMKWTVDTTFRVPDSIFFMQGFEGGRDESRNVEQNTPFSRRQKRLRTG